MTSAEFRVLVDTLAQAWTARDYPRVASHFAEDVAYADPTRYSLDGRAALLEFFEDDGGHDQRVDIHLTIFDEAAQVGTVEYTYTGTYVYHGVAVVKIAEGQITHWREYQHTSTLDWQTFVGRTRF